MRHAASLAFALSLACFGDDSGRLLRLDHYVAVKSAVPAIAGQTAQIYVREVVMAGASARSTKPDRVVLFVHGAGTPAEVAFDVPYQDYSWMAFLARAGYDVFSMDMTGYGRSTRPLAMNDPCNLAVNEQKALFGGACAASYGQQMTTLPSDWNDIGAVVDHLRANRHVEKVSLIGWSLGGPRAGGYAAYHADKVSKLVLLAPAYRRSAPAEPPVKVPAPGPAFGSQSRADFDSNWDRQIGCPEQVDPMAREAVWKDMLASDPQGATWGPGVRRAPLVTTWGWNESVTGRMQIPALLIAAAHDKQVPAAGVKTLYDDMAAKQKVFVDLACASHNALWERNHLLLFRASLEWLREGTVNGNKEGMVKLGY
ncbi:MAG: alpha/beta fold hydrolase [Acidobacteria bacterium]|nr:alpha/beta fold hydrolase [Acidobacteriota bacterium]